MAFTTARLNAAIDAALSGVTHIQLHTGAPGAAGTSNVAAGVAVPRSLVSVRRRVLRTRSRRRGRSLVPVARTPTTACGPR